MLADLIVRNLRARGHIITHQVSGAAALSELFETPQDVLILDVNLPDVSGWDVMRELRLLNERPHTIVVSAAPISSKEIQEYKPEVTLQKPFSIGALLRAMNPATLTSRSSKSEPHDRQS